MSDFIIHLLRDSIRYINAIPIITYIMLLQATIHDRLLQKWVMLELQRHVVLPSPLLLPLLAFLRRYRLPYNATEDPGYPLAVFSRFLKFDYPGRVLFVQLPCVKQPFA